MKTIFDYSQGFTFTENRTNISAIVALQLTHAGFTAPVNRFQTPIPL